MLLPSPFASWVAATVASSSACSASLRILARSAARLFSALALRSSVEPLNENARLRRDLRFREEPFSFNAASCVAAAEALTDRDCLKASVFGVTATSALEMAVAGRGFSALMAKPWGPVLDLGRTAEGAVIGRGSKTCRLGLSM
jgi:hypothetical protein